MLELESACTLSKTGDNWSLGSTNVSALGPRFFFKKLPDDSHVEPRLRITSLKEICMYICTHTYTYTEGDTTLAI